MDDTIFYLDATEAERVTEDVSATVLTIEQLIEIVESLRPERALNAKGNARELLCVTRPIYRIRIGERVFDLAEKGGRLGAGYVRVSTEGQRQDGFSAADQTYRIASYFAERGEAFCIFSDAGLSGTLPIDDPLLVQRVWNKKARLYKELFERVFLTNTEAKYSASDRSLMRLFVEDAYKRIQTGQDVDAIITRADEIPSSDIDSNVATDTEDSIEIPRALNRISVKLKRLYRPALTLLCENLPQYHTIAVSELSRLSRSQLTFAELHEKFADADVDVIGLVENLEWMNARDRRGDVGHQIQAFLLPMIAEHKVRETTLGVLRAIALKFEKKQAHGKIPSWLKRNKDGTVSFGDPKRVEAVQEMIRLYRQGLGFRRIADELTKQGYKADRGANFKSSTVSFTLGNRALCGQQVMFGRPWNIFPAIMTEEEFDALNTYRAERNVLVPNRGRPIKQYHLLASVFKCSCGYTMLHMAGSRTSDGPYWACYAPKTTRKELGHPHPIFRDEVIDNFFGELMRLHWRLLVDVTRTDREADRALHDLNSTTERLTVLQADYLEKKRAAIRQAEEQARSQGIGEDNPFFVQYVNVHTAALTNFLREEVNALKERVATLTEYLGQLSSERHQDGFEERIASWDTLPLRERNRLVTETFDCIRVVGTPPHEHLELQLANAPEGVLPPVPVISLRSRNGGYRRTLPTVQEWLEGAFAPLEPALPEAA
jgi:DNA invertase Pin-like site-specific DNA recombinase